MYSNILVPLDGSSTSERALLEAIRLARLCGARLRLIHVVDPTRRITGFERPEVYVHDILPAILKAGTALLTRARDAVAAEGVPVDATLRESLGERVADVIVEHAAGCGADLIVIGTHGRRGFNRAMLGSEAEQVLRTASVPVMMVKAESAALAELDAGVAA
ncbi:MAG: universal stress protein [Burkholderiaceae bacterium]